MIEARVHNVMDKIVVSVWCNQHGANGSHLLGNYEGDQQGEPGPEQELRVLRDAINHLGRSLHQGEWCFSDEC